MEEKAENKDNFYVVKTKNNNSFYGGGVKYITDLYEAEFYGSYNKIPEELEKNPNLEIINLNSEEGLELILSEIHKSEKYMSIKSHSLGKIICGLRKLNGLFKRVKKESY